MTRLRIVAGSCGEGLGTYEAGAFALPGGGVQGAEDVASLETEGDGPRPSWSGPIVRGLQGAITATQGLPRPIGFAARAVGIGLDILGPGAGPTATVRVTFADGSHAVIAAEAGLAALVARDREVIRRARLRGVGSPETPAPMLLPESDPAPTPMFEYEKRNGRLRRVVPKTDP